ncbi:MULTISPECIES: Fur family transcriptional regulator [Tomitella]|uniref:Transcriptional repressor n=1 Tax=Tomitella cavernea TaxID=1387982 RepID=A0ABP9CU83_9ACTN|nr:MULTISPECIES: Fur family transcriptional regulator [Tomitella]
MTTAGRPAVGVRATKQRSAITAMLEEITDFRSAQDLHDELRRRGAAISLTTVYRTMQSLVDSGEVDVLRTDTGESVYRRCSSGHHHHLVCRRCGYTVEIDGPTVEAWTRTVAAEHGFTEPGHTLEVFGVCSECAGAG